MANGRCRMHGGASTGPRTPDGRARISAARTIHGRYTARYIARSRAFRADCRTTVALTRGLAKLVRSGAAMRLSEAELLDFMPPPLDPPSPAPGTESTGLRSGHGDARAGRPCPSIIVGSSPNPAAHAAIPRPAAARGCPAPGQT